jgi:hypothetical protein
VRAARARAAAAPQSPLAVAWRTSFVFFYRFECCAVLRPERVALRTLGWFGTRCRGWLFRDRAGLGRIREEIYGADHIDVAKTCANLGNAFYQVRPSHTRFLLPRAFDTRSTR